MSFSFFGDESKLPASTVMVGTVSVKKQPSTSRATSSLKTSTGSSGSVSGTNMPKTSSPTLKGTSTPRSASKPVVSKTPSNSTSRRAFMSKEEGEMKRNAATPRTPTSFSPARKRRLQNPRVQVVQSESESDSGSASSSSGSAIDTKHKLKRPKLSRADPSSSAGAGLIGRRVFCWDKTDMRGEWGRGWVGFVGCEEVVRGDIGGWAGGGGGQGEKNWTRYRRFFPQPGFDRDHEHFPSVEVLYPAKDCREKFILLVPTSEREYNPIGELRNTLRLIFEHYIPPSHRHIFGTLSESLDLSHSLSSLPSRVASPSPGSLVTPPPEVSSPFASAEGSTTFTPVPLVGKQETIADLIRKSLASNRRDGPGFVQAIERYNLAMQTMQEDGTLQKWLEEGKKQGREINVRDWATLVDFVHDQAYSRVVGPFSNELEHHPKHPDHVAKAITGKEDAYGELRHAFMSSGVGNCVLQTSLQAGCSSYGFELLPVPAHCARLQVKEVQRRWAMWGLYGNLKVQTYEGDFRVHHEVGKRLREADVVLVNNEVFPENLNMDLANMFLDLKEGARIVSLKPFVPDNFRLNESNCDSFAAILRSTQHDYYQDWVSWKGEWGQYHVAVIDRSQRIKFEESMGGRRSRR
nr:histone-lysine N-methyltransferase, H3 lysine-79 specific [Cryptococcus depauperatus CBS 7841]